MGTGGLKPRKGGVWLLHLWVDSNGFEPTLHRVFVQDDRHPIVTFRNYGVSGTRYDRTVRAIIVWMPNAGECERLRV